MAHDNEGWQLDVTYKRQGLGLPSAVRVVCLPCGAVFDDLLDAHSHWGNENRNENETV